MVGDCWVNNLPPFVIIDKFKFQINIRGYRDIKDILGLEGMPL
jgi:hypothetical protein